MTGDRDTIQDPTICVSYLCEMFALSFDPGLSNLGFALYNLNTRKARLFNVDLTTWKGQKHQMGYAEFGTIIHEFVHSLPSFTGRPALWSELKFIGVERLPVVGTRNILQVASYLEMALRCHAPGVLLFIVDPRSPRSYWGSQGKSYKERKQNSWLVKGLISDTQMTSCKKRFKGHPDAIEALQLCIYLVHNGGSLVTEKAGSFSHASMEVDVIHNHG